MAGQIITVRLSRGDSSPWGFRLQGGKDWGSPLVVSKVNPGSLAEKGGMLVGDYLLKIGNQSVEHMLHHEAQEAIKSLTNNLDLQIQRGATVTWKPDVQVVGDLPKSGVQMNGTATFTKTSLAKNQPEPIRIGSAHNVKPKPFGAEKIPALVHKQFNSPINLYSMDNIRETIKAHSEQLAPGVMGINFMKPDAPVNRDSAVYRAILEEEQNQKGDYYQQLHDSGRGSASPTVQSHAFRRIQQALDSGEEVRTLSPSRTASPMSPPRTGFPSNSITKHVEAPVTKPTTGKPMESNLNTCGQCGGLITGVFCRVRDKNLHAECFKCATCGTSLKNIGYFNINEKLYCDTHAQQAASLLSSGSSYEPIAVKPGAPFPKDAQIIGIGSCPPGGISSAKLYSGPPKITIPPPSSVPSGRPNSPSVLGAVPWHSPGSVHHVDAPTSPRLLQTTTPISVVPPPVAPKPQYKPMSQTSIGGQSPNLYQSHSHPYSGSIGDSQSCGSKFTWPPPKVGPTTPTTPGGNEPNLVQHNSTAQPFRTTATSTTGTKHINYESTKITSDARATTLSSQVSVVSNSGSTSGVPVQGQSSIPGSRPAPRRGRGQLKPQVAPGTRIPICAQCGTPIRGPFIVALGKTWCPDHFNCANEQCRRSLQDIGFVEEQGKLYCEICFEAYLAPICAKCNVRIKGDTLIALDKQWHPECFICVFCKKPFGNSQFYLEDSLPYCEKDWNELFTTKCVSCGFPIEAGDRWVEALNNNYHSQCFKCTICHKNLEGQNFYAKGGRPYCKSHAR